MSRSTSSSRSTTRRPVTAEDIRDLISVSDPQINPAGDRVAFVHAHVGERNRPRRQIWTVPTGKGDPAPFTAGESDRHPRWSPDGTRLAFISEREDHRPQIHLMPSDGGEARAISAFPEGAVGDFRWSPDGRMLAVKFREQDPDWTQEAIRTRKENKLTDPPRVIDDWWYRLDGDGYFNAQRFHLYIVDVETGETRTLYDKDRIGFFDYDWSPTSRELVVSTNRHRQAIVTSRHVELIRIDVQTGHVRVFDKLPGGPKSCVRWSPDGKTIAYAGREGDDSEYSTENLLIWVCDVKSGKGRASTGTKTIASWPRRCPTPPRSVSRPACSGRRTASAFSRGRLAR